MALFISIIALSVPARAQAFELTAGVNGGGVVIGTKPRFAVSPHAGLAWRTDGGFLFVVRNSFTILPTTGAGGLGIYDHAVVGVGYAWTSGALSVGPALGAYSTPACGPDWCVRVAGVSPGAQARLDYYFLGPLGISVSASVDWLTGSPAVPAGAAAMVLVGPFLRWSTK